MLTAQVSLPEPVGSENRTTRRIRRYYRAQCRAFLRYCDRWLFPMAARACPGSAGGQPPPSPVPSGAVLSGHLQRGRLLESVYPNPGASRRWTHSAAPLGRYLGPAAGLSGFASELFSAPAGLEAAPADFGRSGDPASGDCRVRPGIWTAGEGGCGSSSTPCGFTSPRKVLPSSTPCTPSPRPAEGIPVFTVPYEAVGPCVPVSEAEPSSSAPQT